MGLGLGAKTLVAITGATALPPWALSWHSAKTTTVLLKRNSPLVTNGGEEMAAGGFGWKGRIEFTFWEHSQHWSSCENFLAMC